MFAKMLKRKVSRVTTEAPDLSAVAGAAGGDQQTLQTPDSTSPQRGGGGGGQQRDGDGFHHHRAPSVSLPLQYRRVGSRVSVLFATEKTKTQMIGL